MMRVPIAIIAAVALSLCLHAQFDPAHADNFKVLYSFGGGGDGCSPGFGNLAIDGQGNLYGTTQSGLCGQTVFRISSDETHTVLAYVGGNPQSVTLDQAGNLWGITSGGGKGGGSIFEIAKGGKEKQVHSFKGSPHDGCDPVNPMVLDSAGNLYGTTTNCGKHRAGAVFELATDGKESLVYSFSGGRDGLYPFAGLTIDMQGNLYGATDYGGKTNDCSSGFGGCGTIFRFSPIGKKTELYRFGGAPNDGYIPTGNVLVDSSGSVFGTTLGGGLPGCLANEGCGTVFKLTPEGKESVVHFFAGEGGDGANPVAGLIADGAGNLYGTTEYGGGASPCNGSDGCGVIFKIAPDGTETLLHKFKQSTDGANPMAGLVTDGAGNYYGTAYFGGGNGYGTVFEITP